MPLDVLNLVAEPGFAPRDWQAAAPNDSYWGGQNPVQMSSELERVLALPRRAQEVEGTQRADALVQLITRRFGRPPGQCRCAEIDPERHRSDGCIDELRFAQAWALYEIGIAGGLIAPIGVGHGKTLLDFLSILALVPFGVRTALLLVPPGLLTQLVGDYIYVGQHFRVPSMIVHGGDDYTSIIPGEPLLHVLPYSKLSRPTATTWIKDLHPEAIIANEVHKLRDPDTATTSRVLRLFDEFPDTRFCGWSGSITDKSIRDYAHLSGMALKHLSPLPRGPTGPEVVDDWSRAIDPKDNPCDPGELMRFCAPGEHVIDGFRRRVNETCGVVATTVAAVDAELEIVEHCPDGVDADDEDTLPPEVCSALAQVRSGERPDGDPLLDALQQAKCAREVACGFYYRWIFPHGEPVSLILEWLDKRKAWRKELRKKLLDRAEHLDSPMLCQHAAERAWGDRARRDDLPSWRATHWPAWRDVAKLVRPETEAVRISDYLAKDAAEWALANRGIVWYEHSDFGAWVAQLSGLPMYGGGAFGGGLLSRDPQAPGSIVERGDRSIVLSIKAHGTGRNGLQRLFHDQLVANPPANPSAWEQLLGRLHRVGQKAPRVSARFYRHTEELARHVRDALRAALYVEGTIGARQKLRMGFGLDLGGGKDYEPRE
jgi:hypothetical protein